MSANTYLSAAIADIDRRLGEGYAKGHPELIAAYVRTAAIDYAATTLAQQVRAGLDALADAVSSHGPTGD